MFKWRWATFFVAEMALLASGTAHAGDCRILKTFDFSKLVGMEISRVALNLAVEDTGEGHQFADAWTLKPDAKKSMDQRINEVYFYVVNSGGPKSLRGRIETVLVELPDVLKDEALYEEYFGGCGQGDPRRQGIQLGKELCLWATRKHTSSVVITSDKMSRRLYRNSKLLGCQSS